MASTGYEVGVEELVERRDAASAAYYGGDEDAAGSLSDEEFEVLSTDLEALGVPSVVGHGYEPSGAKVAHTLPMLSLAKVVEDPSPGARCDALLPFLTLVGGSALVVEPKYDGLALSIEYGEDGELLVAATRGNGVLGEDVTHTAREMVRHGLLPASIETDGDPVLVRGEVVVTEASLALVNAHTAEHGGRQYKYPRAAAAGLLRREDVSLARFLTFVAFEVHAPGGDAEAVLASGAFTTAASPGFGFREVLAPTADPAEALARVAELVAAFDASRASLDVDTDGVVVKVLDPARRAELGDASDAPRWAVAFKFQNTVRRSTLRAVEWNTGRTGRVVPVAVFDVVVLARAEVGYATLHSHGELGRLDLRVGDSIAVTRANEVIPRVVGLFEPGVHAAAEAGWSVPTECPRCHSAVVLDREHLLCSLGSDCDLVAGVVYAVRTLGVLGVSTALVSALVATGRVASVLDLLSVTEEEVSALPRYGVASAARAVSALRVAREAPLRSWVAALGVRYVASTKSPILAARYESLEALAEARYEDLLELERFGPINARAVVEAAPRVAELARRLREEFDLSPREPRVEVVESAYSGLRVVLTGRFPDLSREEVAAWLTSRGATVSGSVSASTDLLVHGEEAGGKLARAEALGVRTLDATSFLAGTDLTAS